MNTPTKRPRGEEGPLGSPPGRNCRTRHDSASGEQCRATNWRRDRRSWQPHGLLVRLRVVWKVVSLLLYCHAFALYRVHSGQLPCMPTGGERHRRAGLKQRKQPRPRLRCLSRANGPALSFEHCSVSRRTMLLGTPQNPGISPFFGWSRRRSQTATQRKQHCHPQRQHREPHCTAWQAVCQKS